MLKLSQPLVRAAAGQSEKLSALKGLNVGHLSAFLPRSWLASTPLSTSAHVVPSLKSSSTRVSPHLRAAYQALTTGAGRTLSGALPKQMIASRASGARPLTGSWVPKRSYARARTTSWEDLPPMAAPPLAPISPFAFLWRGARGLLSLSTLALHAVAVYWIHSELHRENPTWVSYLSFVPILDWIPMLDIAGLERTWVLVPAALFAAMAAFAPVIPPILAGIVFVVPAVLLEAYRNLHILEHFEVGSTAALVISLLRMEWLIFSGLSILGIERYQLVPHEQASLTDFAVQVAERLDETVADPSIVERSEFNLPLLAFHYIWKTFPSLSGWAQSLKAWNVEQSVEAPEAPVAIEAASVTEKKE